MAQAYYSPISINSGQVPSTQTDFPVLVSQTDARFKTIGNGGHVNNSSGFDIRPYSDTGLTTALTYELERYNASTGEVIMWVKVASLSSSTTPIYLGYGDTSLTTDGSSTTTWSNGFLGVYHLKDGTTLNVNSATGSNNGTNGGGSNSATATSGKIDGAANFVSSSSQFISLGIGMNPTATSLSGWVNAVSHPAAQNSVLVHESSGHNSFLYVDSSHHIDVGCHVANTTQLEVHGTVTLSTATWYYLVMVYDSTNGLKGYVNGSVDGTQGAAGTIDATGSATNIGGNPVVGGRYWNGIIDEARVANVARSANWITTEYNNQNAPGTFETLGSEVTITPAQRGWFMFIP